MSKTKFRANIWGEVENWQQQVILCHGRRLPVKDEWRIEELFVRIFFRLEAFETFDPHKSWRVTFTPQYTRPKNKTWAPKFMPQNFCVALLTSRIWLSHKIWFSIHTPSPTCCFRHIYTQGSGNGRTSSKFPENWCQICAVLSLDRILAQFPGELPAKTSQPSTL